jgi:copper oxidase (laccase) domain-containing protein
MKTCEKNKSLEKTENIRILIGISTNKETFELIQEVKNRSDFDFLTKYHFHPALK